MTETVSGTLVHQNDKTYWFAGGSIVGKEVSIANAFTILQRVAGRGLTSFEQGLLLSRPRVGYVNVTIVSLLVSDPTQESYLKSLRTEVIGYVIRHREDAYRRRFNYGDVIGSDRFVNVYGTLGGKVVCLYKNEPPLESPLIDPVDLVGGLVADFVRVGVKAFWSSFRGSMIRAETKFVARGASSEIASLRALTEEELAKVLGGGTSKPLTDNQIERAIELLRNGKNVHVESIGQMRQIQAELGQLGVRSESSSHLIPQRAAKGEISGSFKDGRGTFRVDPPHDPGKVPYSAHNEYSHVNITLSNGNALAIIVTGSKSF